MMWKRQSEDVGELLEPALVFLKGYLVTIRNSINQEHCHLAFLNYSSMKTGEIGKSTKIFFPSMNYGEEGLLAVLAKPNSERKLHEISQGYCTSFLWQRIVPA